MKPAQAACEGSALGGGNVRRVTEAGYLPDGRRCRVRSGSDREEGGV